MKVTLVLPQSERYRRGGGFSKFLRYSPLTLTTLAALVPEELNAKIEIIDEGVEDLDISKIDADIVGITCITPNAPRVYDLSHQLRSRGIKVVIGGIHPTLVPEEAQEHADSIVVGYAEQTWPQLLRDFAEGKMESRYDEAHDYRFANVPIPRRDLLKKKKYITTNTVQAVRGCTKRCTFCVVPVAWPRYLQRPVEEVVNEIEQLEGKNFLFLDLSPTMDRDYIIKLWKAITPLKKRWGGLATIEIASDPEMMAAASKSGCGGLLIGFESVSTQSIRTMRKGFNKPNDYLTAAKMLHDHGIGINGCFVLGMDGDNEGIFEQTVEFVNKAGIDLPRFSVATPFPGTPFYEEMKQQNRLLYTNYPNDWQYYGGQNVVFKPVGMSVEKLEEGLRWTWKQVYSSKSIATRIYHSAATRHPFKLGVALTSNFGYIKYAKWSPDYIQLPCEVEPWLPGNLKE